MAEGADVFPYDPRAQSERLRGLQKLRAFQDRELAGHLYRLWQALPAGKARPPRERSVQLELGGVEA